MDTIRTSLMSDSLRYVFSSEANANMAEYTIPHSPLTLDHTRIRFLLSQVHTTRVTRVSFSTRTGTAAGEVKTNKKAVRRWENGFEIEELAMGPPAVS